MKIDEKKVPYCTESKLRSDGMYVQFGYEGMEQQNYYWKSGKCWYNVMYIDMDPKYRIDDGKYIDEDGKENNNLDIFYSNARLFSFGEYGHPLYSVEMIMEKKDIFGRETQYGEKMCKILHINHDTPVLETLDYMKESELRKKDLNGGEFFSAWYLTTPISGNKIISTTPSGEKKTFIRDPIILGSYRCQCNDGGWLNMLDKDPHVLINCNECGDGTDESIHYPYYFIPDDRTEKDLWGWKEAMERWENFRKNIQE